LVATSSGINTIDSDTTTIMMSASGLSSACAPTATPNSTKANSPPCDT
jgi:hypothetical protein